MCDGEWPCEGDWGLSGAGKYANAESGIEDKMNTIKLWPYDPAEDPVVTLFDGHTCIGTSAAFNLSEGDGFTKSEL